MAEFIINNKKYGSYTILIDDEDLALVKRFSWTVSNLSGYNYALSNGSDRIHMHRLIVKNFHGNIDGLVIDHINHNTLDNRRANLRPCTSHQNSMNRRVDCPQTQNSSSKYKGVLWLKRAKKWRACVGYRNRKIQIGEFALEVDAARAYDQMARFLFKEFACLNFPDDERSVINIDKVMNRKKHRHSEFVGVTYSKSINLYSARIVVDGKFKELGNFQDDFSAAVCRDKFIIKNNLCIKKHLLNFPGETEFVMSYIYKHKFKNKNGYIGVYMVRKKFAANVIISKKSIRIGTFDTAIIAARAYDLYIVSNNLDRRLNFPEEHIRS